MQSEIKPTSGIEFPITRGGQQLKIGQLGRPQGRFGNRILGLLVLKNISSLIGSDYFYSSVLDSALVPEAFRPLLTNRRSVRFIDALHLVQMAKANRLQDLREVGTRIAVRGPLLGAAFASTDNSMTEKLRFLGSSCRRHASFGSHPSVVLHLRAGDFRAWDGTAIHDHRYYLSAYESLTDIEGSQSVRVIYDDQSHPALGPVLKFFATKNLSSFSWEKCSKSKECDFSALVSATTVISSPSTFAISAGVIGNAQFIFDRAWVKNRAHHKDSFWESVLDFH